MTKRDLFLITRIENCAIAYVQAHYDLKDLSMVDFINKVKEAAYEIDKDVKPYIKVKEDMELPKEVADDVFANRANRYVAAYAKFHYNLKEMTEAEFVEKCMEDAQTLVGYVKENA